MIGRLIVAAAASLAFTWPVAAEEGPTQAIRLCQDLMLYADEPAVDGLWRQIRIEDARGTAAVTYRASTAQVGELRGTPSVLLRDGRVSTPAGETVSFDEFVLRSCPEASLHLVD